MHLSILDLSPVAAGSTPADALHDSLRLARHVEALGYRRYWLAEHHNAASLASSAPEILIAAVAATTTRLRVGSGGIMLPNHSPLHVAEQFRVLHSLYPTRIDLGIGRAAGTDPKTALALRQAKELLGVEGFPAQLDELCHWLTAEPDPDVAFGPMKAVPSFVPTPEMWLLGSGGDGAAIAGARGLGFVYAHHFHPDGLDAAVARYRDAFTASRFCREPRVMVAVSVVCGETDAHADRLASSGAMSWLHFGRGLRDRPMPSVEDATAAALDEDDRTLLADARTRQFVGSRETVRPALEALAARAGADELLVMTQVHDHDERCASYARLV